MSERNRKISVFLSLKLFQWNPCCSPGVRIVNAIPAKSRTCCRYKLFLREKFFKSKISVIPQASRRFIRYGCWRTFLRLQIKPLTTHVKTDDTKRGQCVSECVVEIDFRTFVFSVFWEPLPFCCPLRFGPNRPQGSSRNAANASATLFRFFYRYTFA